MPIETDKIHFPNLIYRIAQNFALIVISLGLIFGGVTILQTRLPFWSLVYGIPAIFLGIIMSLITFNEVIKNRIAKATEYHSVACRICNKQVLVPLLSESAVCTDCQYKMARKMQLIMLLFLGLLAIPVTLHISNQAQNIQQNAQIPKVTPTCEVGRWNPANCQCGWWDTDMKCPRNEKSRICDNATFCCSESSNGWKCKLVPNPK